MRLQPLGGGVKDVGWDSTSNLEDLQVTLEKSLSPVPPTGISDSLGFNKPRKSAELW